MLKFTLFFYSFIHSSSLLYESVTFSNKSLRFVRGLQSFACSLIRSFERLFVVFCNRLTFFSQSNFGRNKKNDPNETDTHTHSSHMISLHSCWFLWCAVVLDTFYKKSIRPTLCSILAIDIEDEIVYDYMQLCSTYTRPQMALKWNGRGEIERVCVCVAAKARNG